MTEVHSEKEERRRRRDKRNCEYRQESTENVRRTDRKQGSQL
jgi:hypothetical protein